VRSIRPDTSAVDHETMMSGCLPRTRSVAELAIENVSTDRARASMPPCAEISPLGGIGVVGDGR